MNPSSGQILYHNSTPLIVPPFSFFVEDLVVGWNATSELGRAGYVAFRIASASTSCNVRVFANLTIWIFGFLSSVGTTLLPASPACLWLISSGVGRHAAAKNLQFDLLLSIEQEVW